MMLMLTTILAVTGLNSGTDATNGRVHSTREARPANPEAIIQSNPSGSSMKIEHLKQIDAIERNSLYPCNQAPLLASPLIKLPPGSCEPSGWVRGQLERERDGFFGHLDELSRFVRYDSGWMNPRNTSWEELPYWLKGFVDLGYVLADQEVIAEAERWIEAALASRQADGYFGPIDNKAGGDFWPHMVMLYALRSRCEYRDDPRIFDLIRGFLRFLYDLPPERFLAFRWGEGRYRKEWWQSVRAGDLMQIIYWTYNRRQEPWLLELAERTHQRGSDWVQGMASWHGVNICQGYREPAIYHQQSHDPAHLAATEARYREVMDLYGQVPGRNGKRAVE